MASIIKEIVVDRRTVAPGETILIQVEPARAEDDLVVAIDGVRGRLQYIQAPMVPGVHDIEVFAGDGAGLSDRQVVQITVEDRAPLPVLAIERDPYRSLAAAFRVVDVADLPRAAGSLYRWRFGETEVETAEPTIVYDFAEAVDHTKPFTNVDVALRVVAPDGAETLVQRTLAVWSSYQILRQAGYIQPPVSTDGVAVRGNGSAYSASARISNVETQAVNFTARRIEWLTAGLDDDNPPGPEEPVAIMIPASSRTDVAVSVDRSAAPDGADGFVVHLFGTAADGTPAHTFAAFEFARRPIRHKVPDKVVFQKPSLIDTVADLLGSNGPRPEWVERLATSAAGSLDERQLWALGVASQATPSDMLTSPVTLQGADVRAVESLFTPLNTVVPDAAAGNAVLRGGIDNAVLREGVGNAVLRQGVGNAALREGVGNAALREGAGNAFRRAEDRSGESVPTLGLRLGRRVFRDLIEDHLDSTALRNVRPVIEGLQRTPGGMTPWAQEWVDIAPSIFAIGDTPTENSACDPDDMPDPIPDGWACQFTGEYEQRWLPGRILNAKKGDVILSPGGNGLIGGLLKQVSPPQRYSHTAIMTRNHYEVSHSTGSDSWLEDHANGSILGEPAPTDGFDPKALKYLWPGGITQTSEEGYRGSKFTAPGGKQYDLKCFGLEDTSQFGDRWELIPAMVVKPHPSKETPEVRKGLHRVAEQVRSWCVTGADTAAGKQSGVHYRFFCYSDAAIAVRPDQTTGRPVGVAPEEGSWPGGTLPTVCSSIIWLAARTVGQHMEGTGDVASVAELEPDDLAKGAQVDGGTLDGLYLYSADERRTAAEWLHTYLRDKIIKTTRAKAPLDELGAISEALADMGDDCANQMVNSFALDWSDTDAKDSEKWRDEMSAGRAVSPDNLMFYDAPSIGLWGYAVPLIYRAARFENIPVTKWRQTSGPGTLSGVVTMGNGAAASHAEVNVGGSVVFAGADGRFRVEVQEGRYPVRATFQAPHGWCQATKDVTVRFRETTDVTIALDDPPELFRELVITGYADGNDDEGFLEDDENMHAGVHIGPLQLGPYGTHAESGWGKSWGGEVRAEFDVKADWLPDNAVAVHVFGRLYEGASESTGDLDGKTEAHWTIPPGATHKYEVYMRNDDEDENTWCRLNVDVTNRRAS